LRIIIYIVASLLLAGCVTNPVNRHTAYRYAEQAENYARQGDWLNAQEGYRRAIINAKIGGFKEKDLSVLWYQYGRASGVICDWAESEKGFNKANELDRKNGNPTYKNLNEQGQMNFDRKDYLKAVKAFELAHAEIEETQIPVQYPISYALLLNNYADALEATNNKNKAKSYRKAADEIYKKNPGTNKNIRRTTPYGSQCKTAP